MKWNSAWNLLRDKQVMTLIGIFNQLIENCNFTGIFSQVSKFKLHVNIYVSKFTHQILCSPQCCRIFWWRTFRDFLVLNELQLKLPFLILFVWEICSGNLRDAFFLNNTLIFLSIFLLYQPHDFFLYPFQVRLLKSLFQKIFTYQK